MVCPYGIWNTFSTAPTSIAPRRPIHANHNSPPVEGCQAPLDGVVFCVPTNFPKTVGADSYIRPNASCGHNLGLLKKYHYAPVEGNCLVQNHHNHPVRLRLPPLHRRGMVCPYGMLKKYHYAPVEGNCLVQNHHNHPVRLRLPPLHRRGMVCPYGMLKKYHYAPVEGNCLVQNHHNHPVRLRLPPLHRRGMVCPYGMLKKYHHAS